MAHQAPIQDFPAKAHKKLSPAEMREAISQLCQEANYDPFKELINLAQATQDVEINGTIVRCPVADPDQRIAIAKEIAQYLAPNLKSIEVQGQIDATFTFKVVHFTETGNTLDIPAEVKQIAEVKIQDSSGVSQTQKESGNSLHPVKEDGEVVKVKEWKPMEHTETPAPGKNGRMV